VKLFHGADHILDVLNDMDGPDLCERAVAKRVREAVEVGEDVGAAGRIAVDADGARELVDAAPYVENEAGAGGLGMVWRNLQYRPNLRCALALSSDVPARGFTAVGLPDSSGGRPKAPRIVWPLAFAPEGPSARRK